jgi:hypothetical protein
MKNQQTMTSQEKKNQIENLTRKQLGLVTKALVIANAPQPKRFTTGMRRLGKILAIGTEVKMIEAQKQIIASQPVPKYPAGRPSQAEQVRQAIALAGDTGAEYVILADGTTVDISQHR